jgi:hypothetical protein
MRHGWKSLPEFEAVLNELRTQNDRGMAITAGATVEHALQLAIEAKWPAMSKTRRDEVFGDNSPLGTFSAKIIVACAMGLIHDTTTIRLHIMRRIRNEFAHDMKPINFASERPLKLCQKLPDPDFLAGTAKIVPPADTNERMRSRVIDQTHALSILLLRDMEIPGT